MIKSHLQKTIRRQDDNKAILTAWTMIKMDILAFIRRIMIIMIEDVCLHESFIILQWLLCAISNKSFRIQKNHIKWLLGVVHMLSINLNKDIILENKDKINLLYDLNNKFLELDSKYYSLLYSLHFRKSYGGMSSDMELIDKSIYTWYNRFIGNRKYNINNPIKCISLNILPLEKEDWLLSSIDFHCCPYILQWIHKKYPKLSMERIKTLMWNYNSKLNTRLNVKDNNIEWNKIKNDIESMQRYIIDIYS